MKIFSEVIKRHFLEEKIRHLEDCSPSGWLNCCLNQFFSQTLQWCFIYTHLQQLIPGNFVISVQVIQTERNWKKNNKKNVCVRDHTVIILENIMNTHDTGHCPLPFDRAIDSQSSLFVLLLSGSLAAFLLFSLSSIGLKWAKVRMKPRKFTWSSLKVRE